VRIFPLLVMILVAAVASSAVGAQQLVRTVPTNSIDADLTVAALPIHLEITFDTLATGDRAGLKRVLAAAGVTVSGDASVVRASVPTASGQRALAATTAQFDFTPAQGQVHLFVGLNGPTTSAATATATAYDRAGAVLATATADLGLGPAPALFALALRSGEETITQVTVAFTTARRQVVGLIDSLELDPAGSGIPIPPNLFYGDPGSGTAARVGGSLAPANAVILARSPAGQAIDAVRVNADGSWVLRLDTRVAAQVDFTIAVPNEVGGFDETAAAATQGIQIGDSSNLAFDLALPLEFDRLSPDDLPLPVIGGHGSGTKTNTGQPTATLPAASGITPFDPTYWYNKVGGMPVSGVASQDAGDPMLPRERVSPGQWGWVRLDWTSISGGDDYVSLPFPRCLQDLHFEGLCRAPNGPLIAAVPAAFNLVPGHFTPSPHLVGDYLYVASLNDQVLQVGTFHDPLELIPHADDEFYDPLAVSAGQTHLSLPERFTTAAALATARVDLYQLGPVGYDAPITVTNAARLIAQSTLVGSIGPDALLAAFGRQTTRTVALVPGFQLVGWTGGATTAAALTADAAFARGAHSFFPLDRHTQRYRSFTSTAPAFVNDFAELGTREALWVRVDAATTWDQPVESGDHTVNLGPGWNTVTWTGADVTSVATAFAGVSAQVTKVVRYNPAGASWDTWVPDAPIAALNTLRTLDFGEGLLVLMAAPATWTVAAGETAALRTAAHVETPATATTLQELGDPGDKLVMVVMGDGWAAGADQAEFNTLVQTKIMDGIFGAAPYKEDLSAWNIYRINAISTDSGLSSCTYAAATADLDGDGDIDADDDCPDPVPMNDSALEFVPSGNWNNGWMKRGPESIRNDLIDHLVPGGVANAVVIILNTTESGGQRSGNTMIAMKGSGTTTFIHEAGHGLGNLKDEYMSSAGCANPVAWTGSEPNNANITSTLSPLKWAEFVDPAMPIAAAGGYSGGAYRGNDETGTECIAEGSWSDTPAADAGFDKWSTGVFAGARAKRVDLYRPSFKSTMKNNTPPFNDPSYKQIRVSYYADTEHSFDRPYVGDFDGDGQTDLVLHTPHQLTLFLATGPVVNYGRAERPRLADASAVYTGGMTGVNGAVWRDFLEHDRFFVADFNGDGRDDLYVVNTEDYYHTYLGLLRATGTGFELVQRYINGIPGGKVPGGFPSPVEWVLSPTDQFFVGDFDGDGDEDLYVHGFACSWKIELSFWFFDFSICLAWENGHFGMLRSDGTAHPTTPGLETIERFSVNYYGLPIGKADELYVADFDGDGRDDLYIVNLTDHAVPHLLMQRSTGTSLAYVERYDLELPGWDDMRADDQFFVADWDGDGDKDLYVFNGVDWVVPYLGLLEARQLGLAIVPALSTSQVPPGVITTLSGTHLATAQLYAGGTVPYGDRLAGWGVHPHDQFYAADTNGDGAVDLYAVNTTDFATEYLGILESEGMSDALDVRGWQADRIGEWDLRAIDHFLVGNFNGGLGWDDLFVSNSEWFGLLRSRRSSVQNDAIYYHWIHTVEYHANDWW
jgi:hypothetical protein